MAFLNCSFEKVLNEFKLTVSLTVDSGIHVLFGRSGVGKTQTLECIAGLSLPDTGQITLDGRTLFRKNLTEKSINIPPRGRKIGYVFQDGALFPHKTLLENVQYPKNRISEERSAEQLLENMGMIHLADRYPHEVSGGQKRRAAVARALAADPAVLLLDEPFVHLDRVVRSKLIDDLVKTISERRISTLLVTHDLEVAARLAEHISVIEDGQIVQSGQREEVLFKPADGRIARLFGEVNILNGEVIETSGGVWLINTAGLLWRVPYVGILEKSQAVEVIVRCAALKILKPDFPVPDDLKINRHLARIMEIRQQIDSCRVEFRLGPFVSLVGSIPSDTFERSGLNDGDDCEITVSVSGLSLIPIN